MSLRTVLLLLVALATAGVTAFYVRSITRAPAPVAVAPAPEVKPPEVMRVLVASKDLTAGTFLTEDVLKWEPWPKKSRIEGLMVEGEKTIEDLMGAVVRTAVTQGQPILARMLVFPGDRGFLAAVLEPGMRGVTVPVGDATGGGGFIFPGDSVDVIARIRIKQSESEGEGGVPGGGSAPRFAAVTALRGVRVLAMDQKTENIGSEVSVAKTATLEVTPKQAEELNVIVDMGNLSLSLNSLSEPEDDDPDTVDPWWRRDPHRRAGGGGAGGGRAGGGGDPDSGPSPRRPGPGQTVADDAGTAPAWGPIPAALAVGGRQDPPSPELLAFLESLRAGAVPGADGGAARASPGPAGLVLTPGGDGGGGLVPTTLRGGRAWDASAPGDAAPGGPVQQANAGILDLSVAHDVDRNFTMDWELFKIDGLDMITLSAYALSQAASGQQGGGSARILRGTEQSESVY